MSEKRNYRTYTAVVSGGVIQGFCHVDVRHSRDQAAPDWLRLFQMGQNTSISGPRVNPPRIRIHRRAGWFLPDGYVWIARPSRWSNPVRIEGEVYREDAVRGFRSLLLEEKLPVTVEDIRREIGEPGHGVACYCRQDQDCHGDVILEVAYS